MRNNHIGFKITERNENGKFYIDVKVRAWYFVYLKIVCFFKYIFR